LPLSASVGVAPYPLCGTTIKTLLASADFALYQAKANGKRQAVAADALSGPAADSASTA